MEYTTLGRTGLRVSKLGFGAMRLPMSGNRVNRELAIPMIHRAFEAGVNYIDTAVGYCEQDSQRVVGEALKGWRDKIVLSTKNHYYDEDEKAWWQNLEDSLERLRVEAIDIYNTHGVNWQRYQEQVRPRVGKWLVKARDQGLIRHICTSIHDKNDALRHIVDEDFYESITLQYNLLDRQLEDGIAYAHEKDMGVVVMGPVGGGQLGVESEVLEKLVPNVKRMPELALKFVLSNPNVNVALSGMSSMQHVEENIAVASDERGLNEEEIKIINDQVERLKKMADLYCTGCDYCKPCPEEVNISAVFKLFNYARVYGMTAFAKERYAAWRETLPEGGMQADSCVECGECEAKCPQSIPIREQLKEAHRLLSGE